MSRGILRQFGSYGGLLLSRPLRRKHLVRALTVHERKWWNGTITVDEAAQSAFEQSGSKPVSTYIATGPFEEATISAAHFLTRTASPPCHLLRIPLDLLFSVQLKAKLEPSTQTGVASVDRFHVDLTGDAAEFERLTQAALDAHRRGRDLVRRIEKGFVQTQLERFTTEYRGISDETVRNAQNVLSRWKK